LEKGRFTVSVPSSVRLETEALDKAKAEVIKYSANMLPSTERSYSIRNPRSVHHFWNRLIGIVTADERSSHLQGTRIVYEWSIPHPLEDKIQRIDFTFIPETLSHLNWVQYRGGIELKVNAKKASESGLLMSDGLSQAVSRAAMCVYARCEVTKWSPLTSIGHRAFCIFANAQQMGVVRVTIGENLTVSVDVHGPLSLLGHNGSTDTTGLLILKHTLCSKPDELLDLISPPPSWHEAPLKGASDTGSEEIWSLGDFLGSGGFGFVCAGECWGAEEEKDEDEACIKSVIKTSILEKHRSKLKVEREALSELRSRLDAESLKTVPKVIAVLKDSSQKTVALRLLPRGISASRFLDLLGTGADAVLLTRLVRTLGTTMVDCLERVHSAFVYHGDVRLPNLLLVPPPDSMKRIASCRGDVRNEMTIVADIRPEDCSFVLIDWGLAEAINKKNTNRAKLDLLGLVKALSDPLSLTAVSDVSLASGKSESPQSTCEFTPGAVGPPRLQKEALKELLKCAEDMDYNGLKTLFGGISFIP
jgi:hypothetical protein